MRSWRTRLLDHLVGKADNRIGLKRLIAFEVRIDPHYGAMPSGHGQFGVATTVRL